MPAISTPTRPRENAALYWYKPGRGPGGAKRTPLIACCGDEVQLKRGFDLRGLINPLEP